MIKLKKNGHRGASFGIKCFSVIVFLAVVLLIVSELSVFATYFLPVLATVMLNASITGSADVVEYLILWGFPMLFIIFVAGFFHFVCIRYLLLKMFKWLLKVWSMAKTAED